MTTADLAADTTLAHDVDLGIRRALVEGVASPVLDGISAIDVLANFPGSPGSQPGAPRQRTLLVELLRGPVPASLTATQVRVLGGVRVDPRINPVRVDWAFPAVALSGDATNPPVDSLPGVTAADRALVNATCPQERRARVFVVRTSSSGDWSTYVLKLLAANGFGSPVGFDEPLCQVPFSFSVDCPSDLDCRTDSGAASLPPTSPALNYLARDYTALRSRLLDRVSALIPNWSDRNPADPVVTLVELFAATGDRLAAWQDAAAAEAYLSTARLRTSVRRHTRLLDYPLHDGCSARTWLAFTTPAPLDLPGGTAAAGPPQPAPGATGGAATVAQAAAAGDVVFQTCRPIRILPSRNAVLLHSWGDPQHTLPAGSTSAFIACSGSDEPGLHTGDVLVLVPLGPDGTTATGDPALRHVVRLERDPVLHDDPLSVRPLVLEIHWSVQDALSVPFPVSQPASGGSAQIIAVALANVVLADDGGTIEAEPLDPPQVPRGLPYRPRLRHAGLAWAQPPASDSGPAGTSFGPAPVLTSATAQLRPDPHQAVPALDLDDGARAWLARTDLLPSTRLDPHLVVEAEPGQPAVLRFGDGISGRRPTVGTTMTATYRLGGGTRGNVGPDVLTRLLAGPGGSVPDGVSVTNPLAASGGTDPQSISEAKQLAPQAFRTQLRAVTDADYAATAMTDPAVQRAVARRRWSGSWYAHEVTVDPLAGPSGELTIPAGLAPLLDVRRMAGADTELALPVFVSLEIVIGVCVLPGYQRSDVVRALTRAFSSRLQADGTRGFFHPDNLTFGQPVFLSDIVARAMTVAGVAWVDVGDDDSGLRFRRLGHPVPTAVTRGVLPATAREVLRADSDPSTPEFGRFGVLVTGVA